MAGSEGHVFEAPEYAVCGATRYDQRWIDGNVEAGIGAFGWQRPKPRPDTIGPCRPAPAAQVKPAPHKRPSLVQRVRSKITGKPHEAAPEPVQYLPPAEPIRPAAVQPAEPREYEPRHVDPVLDLLGPS